jgi:hypothetical protein
MFRIRFHGRGGQGMKTASRIPGTAFFEAGYEVQDARIPVLATPEKIEDRACLPGIGRRCAAAAEALTGVWPSKEYVDGDVRHTMVPKRRKTVGACLQPRGRFGHLFEPWRDEQGIAGIQTRVDAYREKAVPK